MFGKKSTSPLKPGSTAPQKPPTSPLKPGAPTTTPPRASPAQPLPQGQPAGWAVSLLTTNYMITGYLAPIEMSTLIGWLNIPTQTMLTLRRAQVTALDPKVITPSETLPEITVPKSSIIVLLPRDELSLRAAAAQMPSRQERAIIYAGPYWLKACFRLVGEMQLRNLFGTSGGDMLAVSDVEIKCVREEAKFQSQKADVVIINKNQVQLYHAG